MSSQFHNRLVGTIVIVALGVIFLPDILDGKKDREQETFSEIPLKPAVVEKRPEHTNFEVLPVAETMTIDSTKKTQGTEKNDLPKQSIKSTKTDPVGWTIQLGTFSDAANVESLVAKLRLSGFTAYTVPNKLQKGVLTKVFVGPNISKDKLTKIQKEVEKLTKLKGRVVVFEPLTS